MYTVLFRYVSKLNLKMPPSNLQTATTPVLCDEVPLFTVLGYNSPLQPLCVTQCENLESECCVKIDFKTFNKVLDWTNLSHENILK